MWRSLSLLCLTVLLAGCLQSKYADQSPYHQPFVSPGLKFLGLPTAVQATIRAEAGTAEIVDIGRYEVHGSPFYKVWFRMGGVYPPLYIAPDGSVLNSDLTVSMRPPVENYGELTGHTFGSVALADLPADVVKTISIHAPTSEIERIKSVGGETNRVYEVQFKGPKAPPPIKIDASGKILKDESK